MVRATDLTVSGHAILRPILAAMSCFWCYHESLFLDWEIRIATRAAMFTARYI